MFTVLGEALTDMVQPSAGNVYRAMPAGGPLNIAVGLRRLGHPTAMMARFSAGALGERVRRYAVDERLDLSASVVTDEQATLAFATLDESGRASYDFYINGTADWGWTDAELGRVPASSQAVHTGSLAAAVEPGATGISRLWSDLHSVGQVLLSFDPNVRPAIAGARQVAVRRIERLVALSHVVKASDEDLGWLYPDTDPEEAIRGWVGLGPALCVLTRGDEGSLGVTSDLVAVEVAAPQVTPVDTIGAGDAFQAGLLSAIADSGRLSPRTIYALTEDDVQGVLGRAATVAALTCERAGADPPTRAEYESTVVDR